MEIEFLVTCEGLPYVILNRSVTNELGKIARENDFTLVDISPISRNGDVDEFTYQIVLTDRFDDFDHIYELRSAYFTFECMAWDFLKKCGRLQKTDEKL